MFNHPLTRYFHFILTTCRFSSTCISFPFSTPKKEPDCGSCKNLLRDHEKKTAKGKASGGFRRHKKDDIEEVKGRKNLIKIGDILETMRLLNKSLKKSLLENLPTPMNFKSTTSGKIRVKHKKEVITT